MGYSRPVSIVEQAVVAIAGNRGTQVYSYGVRVCQLAGIVNEPIPALELSEPSSSLAASHCDFGQSSELGVFIFEMTELLHKMVEGEKFLLTELTCQVPGTMLCVQKLSSEGQLLFSSMGKVCTWGP